MNKIYTILLLSLTLFVAGCSDDDDDKVVQNLKVIESQTEYPSLGGTGTIEVSSVGAFTATSSETWCKPSISGNIITVTIAQNTDIEGRHARIEIASGDEKLYVAVTQLGTTFIADKDKIIIPHVGGTEVISFNSEKPVTIKVDPADNWFSYDLDVEKKTVKFTISKLNISKASDVRTAKVELTSGIVTKTITISQQLGYQDLIGYWTISYRDKDLVQRNATVALVPYDNGKSYALIGLPPYSLECIVSFRESSQQLIINSGQHVGNYSSTRALYLGFWDFNGFHTPALYTSAEYAGSFDKNASNYVFKFADNTTWPEHLIRGISLTAWDNNGSLYVGMDDILDNVIITKQ